MSDRLGNVGVSAPITIRLPTAAQAADTRTGPVPSPAPSAGEAPGAAVAWAREQVRRFHARRGVRLTAPRAGGAQRGAPGGAPSASTTRGRYVGLHHLRGDGAARALGGAGTPAAGRRPPPDAGRGGGDDLAGRRRPDGHGAGGAPPRDAARDGALGRRRRGRHAIGAGVRGGDHRGGDGRPAAPVRRPGRRAGRAATAAAGRRGALSPRVPRRGGLGAAAVGARDRVEARLGARPRMAGPRRRHLGRRPLGPSVGGDPHPGGAAAGGGASGRVSALSRGRRRRSRRRRRGAPPRSRRRGGPAPPPGACRPGRGPDWRPHPGRPG